MDLPDPGTEPTSLALAGGFFTPEPVWSIWNQHLAGDENLRPRHPRQSLLF